MPPAKRPGDVPANDFTDSDLAVLRSIIDEYKFSKQFEARRDRIVSSVKSAATWAGAVIGGFVLLKDSIAGAWKWFLHLITGGP